MNTAAASRDSAPISILLRGQWELCVEWTQQWSTRRVLLWTAFIVLGAGLYGAAMGCWRSPLQAIYNLVKFPLVLMFVATGNAILNGMLAPLLGLNISFRQSFLAILMSFTIAAAILGAFSPLVFFLVWNTAAIEVDPAAYHFLLLLQVVIIAFAGITANLRLWQFLHAFSGSAQVARRVLFAWLAGNLFFGSQLCWILRPFIGSPGLPVEFLRTDALAGNFYEALFRSARNLF